MGGGGVAGARGWGRASWAGVPGGGPRAGLGGGGGRPLGDRGGGGGGVAWGGGAVGAGGVGVGGGGGAGGRRGVREGARWRVFGGGGRRFVSRSCDCVAAAGSRSRGRGAMRVAACRARVARTDIILDSFVMRARRLSGICSPMRPAQVRARSVSSRRRLRPTHCLRCTTARRGDVAARSPGVRPGSPRSDPGAEGRPGRSRARSA